jgi:hypothetical protein
VLALTNRPRNGMARGNPQQHQNDFWASYIGSTVIVPVDGTVHYNSTPLPPRRYVAYCRETGVYLRQGGPGRPPRVTSADFLLDEGRYFYFNVDDVNNGVIYVTTAAGLGGSLRITNVSDET